MPAFENKVVLVTGGSGGIGSFAVEGFVAQGATVIVCDIAEESAVADAATILRRGGKAQGLRLDVASEESWRKAIQIVEQNWGRVDVLVNNAGVNDRGTLTTTQLSGWERTIAVNLTGAFLGMKSVAPIMRAGGGGAIVNICSMAAHHGEAFAAYGASKWGLLGLTKIAAMELLESCIRVNSVSPTVVETDLNAGQPYIEPMRAMTPMGRNARGKEIADAIVFLAGETASFITGQDIVVDGGFTAGAAARHVRLQAFAATGV